MQTFIVYDPTTDADGNWEKNSIPIPLDISGQTTFRPGTITNDPAGPDGNYLIVQYANQPSSTPAWLNRLYTISESLANADITQAQYDAIQLLIPAVAAFDKAKQAYRAFNQTRVAYNNEVGGQYEITLDIDPGSWNIGQQIQDLINLFPDDNLFRILYTHSSFGVPLRTGV